MHRTSRLRKSSSALSVGNQSAQWVGLSVMREIFPAMSCLISWLTLCSLQVDKWISSLLWGMCSGSDLMNKSQDYDIGLTVQVVVFPSGEKSPVRQGLNTTMSVQLSANWLINRLNKDRRLLGKQSRRIIQTDMLPELSAQITGKNTATASVCVYLYSKTGSSLSWEQCLVLRESVCVSLLTLPCAGLSSNAAQLCGLEGRGDWWSRSSALRHDYERKRQGPVASIGISLFKKANFKTFMSV